MPSLRDIEKSVSTLWLDAEARRWLLSGGKGPRPESLKDVPEEVLKTVDRKGVELYGGLLNFGHQDVMESIYPYCKQLLSKHWDTVVHDYLAKYPADHYNFNKLCSKLSQYLTTYGGTHLQRYPFLAELADYEWIELEKMEADADIKLQPHQPLSSPEQIAGSAPLLNPTLSVRKYKYNIPEIVARLENGKRPSARLLEPEETYVAIYRNPETHRCKFVEVGEPAALLLQRIAEEESGRQSSYQELIPYIVSLTPDTDPHKAVQDYLELIEDLQDLFVFVGSVRIG